VIQLPRLYGVADRTFGDPVSLAEALFQGGVRLVQLRDKTASSRSLVESARAIVRKAPPDGWVIVNDRVDVALLAGAHGVHVGQDDLPVPDVRNIAGPGFMIGLSTHTPDQVAEADALGVDYIAYGPVFETDTKANPSPVVGCEGLLAAGKLTRRPVVAIGGIGFDDLAAVLATGVSSVAIVSALLRGGDPARRAAEFLEKLDRIRCV
jgi:thiamine-phosphate pyrophosphorylase